MGNKSSRFLDKISHTLIAFKDKLFKYVYGSPGESRYRFDPSIRGLSSEREEELIDWAARQIVKRGLELPALTYLEAFRYYGYPMAYLNILPLAPILDALGINAYEFVDLLSKRENVERIIYKIQEFNEEPQ